MPVAAQTASQLAPKSFVPPPPPRPPAPEAPAAPPPAPAAADDLFVTLSGVTVEGGLPAMAEAEAGFAAELAGKRLSGSGIFAAARTLERAYARAGFVLARVIVPPQHLDDGARLRLEVIDGFIERIAVTAPHARLRRLIERRLAALRGVRGLTLHTIERRIELAADLPGVTVRSALTPGVAPGSTVLVIDAGFQRVDGTISLDNTLASALGGVQAGTGVNLHDLAGIGDELYVRASGFPGAGSDGVFARFARNRAVAAGAVVPIGSDGITINAEGLLARTTPASPVDLRFTDRFDRTSLRLRYPWLRSRTLTVTGSAALDIENESQSALVADIVLPLSEDRMRVVRAGVEVARTDRRRGTLTASLTLSRGLDALGARTAAAATALLPLSRQGADATFTRLDAAFGYAGAISRRLTLSVAARAQTAFGAALLHAEQFGIAGPGALSAFDSGSLQGDAGAVGRVDGRAATAAAGTGTRSSPRLMSSARPGSSRWPRRPPRKRASCAPRRTARESRSAARRGRSRARRSRSNMRGRNAATARP